MAKLKDVVRIACGLEPKTEAERIKAVGFVAEVCRFQLGMNYDQTLAFVQRTDPSMTLARWDALLEEADAAE